MKDNQSILVMNTPESCSECILQVHHSNRKFMCSALRVLMNNGENIKSRHPQCPLKQLPSKEHLTSVLENGDLFIKNHTLQDIINTIYSNNK